MHPRAAKRRKHRLGPLQALCQNVPVIVGQPRRLDVEFDKAGAARQMHVEIVPEHRFRLAAVEFLRLVVEDRAQRELRLLPHPEFVIALIAVDQFFGARTAACGIPRVDHP